MDKTTVTLVQSRDGQVRRVRIGDRELAVLHAGPILADGKMAVTMTLVDVVVDVEKADESTAGA